MLLVHLSGFVIIAHLSLAPMCLNDELLGD